MMGEKMVEHGQGELIEARRRRQFWWTVGALFGVGLVIGGFAGANAALKGVPFSQIWGEIPQSLAVGVIAVALVMFIYGCWRFYKAIDEVELVDNLWASTASYYVYATLFPVWWALGKAGIVAEPHDWAIYFAALAGGMAIYGVRKWRAR